MNTRSLLCTLALVSTLLGSAEASSPPAVEVIEFETPHLIMVVRVGPHAARPASPQGRGGLHRPSDEGRVRRVPREKISRISPSKA